MKGQRVATVLVGMAAACANSPGSPATNPQSDSGNAASSGISTSNGATHGSSASSAATSTMASAGHSGSIATVSDASAPLDATVASDNVVVNLGTTYQTMVGFGAADVYSPGGALSSSLGTLFFDPTNGIGLSILRVGIDTNGSILGSGAYSDIRLAASHGAIVWATPWSPPASDKDNDDVNDGGHLLTADYSSWASVLAGFVATVKSQTGVQLYGVSAQNEPENAVPYSSCVYTGAQMVAFVKVLGPMLHALNPPVKLLAAEPAAWSDLWTDGERYGAAILADPGAAADVDILATHDYYATDPSLAFHPVAPPAGVTAPIWETEVSGVAMTSQAGPSSDIANGIAVAQWIYNALVTGGVSAWHYWWLVSQNNDNEGLLLQDGGATKRLHTVGNFSKFVRPGYQRVDVSGAVPSGVQVVGFANPSDGTVVVVAINTNSTATTLPLAVTGTQVPTQLTPWVTAANQDLAEQTAVSVSAGSASISLAAESVTTLVGK
jgi:glucuronoarabinoxylan endo-1,4-beta-xylanase